MLARDEADSLSTGDPRELHYYFNGVMIGDVSNNGSSTTDYAQTIAQHAAAQGTGPFAGGSASAAPAADFDQSYDPLNGLDYAAADSRYTVQDGDTLGSIARSLWGDANLWYKLADANGLTGSDALVAGQSLIVPTGVQRNANTASTFRPYDPGQAQGDLSPVAVKPPAAKNKHCGAFGAILLSAVAVAVTAILKVPAANLLNSLGVSGGTVGVTGGAITAGSSIALGSEAAIGGAVLAGAAGAVASQAVGVATGIQDRFDWTGVALAGISAGVGGALGQGGLFGQAGILSGVGSDTVRGALTGAVSNVAVQGIAVATGLQSHFDWTGVAVGAAVGGGVHSVPLGGLGGEILSGMAGALAGGAIRSIIDGSDFGDNMLAALPDVIGQTIGEALGNALSSAFDTRTAPDPASPGPQIVLGLVAPAGMGGGAYQDNEAQQAQSGDIVVTAPRWIDEVGSLFSRFGDWLFGGAQTTFDDLTSLGNRITGSITQSLSDQNFGRTAIDSAAMIVGGPGTRAWVDSHLSARNAAAFGGAVKQDLASAVHAGMGVAALYRGDIFNDDAQAIVNGASGTMNYLGTLVTDPMAAANSVVRGYAAVKQSYHQFGQLDAAGKQEVVFRGLGHAATVIAATAATGGLGDAAFAARSGAEMIEPLAAETTPSLEAAYQARYTSAYERGVVFVDGEIAAGRMAPAAGQPPHLYRAGRIDAFAREDLKLYAEMQGHSSDIVRINQRLYLNGDSGAYRVPDLYFPRSRTIFDGTLGTKTLSTPQIKDFRTATGNAPVGIVRPEGYGGFYWLTK